MTHTSTEQPEALAQECADYATSLRSAAMAVKLEGRTPPASFLRAAELFERAATELNIKHARIIELEAQTAHMADLVELADYATKKLEASQAQRVPLTDAQIHDWWRSENSLEDCDMCRFADFAQVVRALELKYGITQKKQG